MREKEGEEGQDTERKGSLREEGHGLLIQVARKPTLQGLWPVHVGKLEPSKPLGPHEHVSLLRCQRACHHIDIVVVTCLPEEVSLPSKLSTDL